MPPGISIGFAAPKSKKPLGPPKPKKPLNAFAGHDDDDHEDGHSGAEEEGGSGVFAKQQQKLNKKRGGGKDVSIVNAQLATFNELSKKAEKTAAQIEDPSIYDYDGAWESMKRVDRSKKKAEEIDTAQRKPKYMENLLAAAEVRRRDQLRAKEKMLQKEREEEGEEFKDKESFVTGAYKKQQEEMRKLEEEERLREGVYPPPLLVTRNVLTSVRVRVRTDALKKKSHGMSSFHKNILNKMESRHDLLVAVAESKGTPHEALEGVDDNDTIDLDRLATEKAQQLKGKGTNIEINEEGQVVDKSELLSGGLNVTAKKKPTASSSQATATDTRRHTQGYQGRGRAQQDMRARQSKMLEEQLAQATKRALEDEEQSRAELERQSKSRKTETDVKSAKERYLARKAAAGTMP